MPTEQQNGQEAPYRKIAIVGSWSETKDQVPYDDVSLEIWALSWRSDVKRRTRAFDLHDLSFLDNPEEGKTHRVPANYPQHMVNLKCPVYLQKARKDVPNSISYPLKEIQGFFMHIDPNHTKPYFASTISFMLAMAIAEGINEIQLYGVDLSEHEEWGYQKPNTEFYLGMARGRGIRVVVPEASSLLSFTHTYGYDVRPEESDLFLEALKKRHKHYIDMGTKLMIEKATYDGARQEAVEQIKHIAQGASRSSGTNKEVPDLVLDALEEKVDKKPKVKTKKEPKGELTSNVTTPIGN